MEKSQWKSHREEVENENALNNMLRITRKMSHKKLASPPTAETNPVRKMLIICLKIWMKLYLNLLPGIMNADHRMNNMLRMIRKTSNNKLAFNYAKVQ